ncbi:hypothetical protein GGTG_07944 [Gaeumannomyces tritici R3-111a-1]|uniref:F-box domain-containing protein n=1 Tax=Gaeumannomyces tritici (strain R3-111a-1) TaxID=644352 RepID=J3P354_GAET3|nr:hypothetical protein GGTG_07944 [Gaeumannomyces tritici R3-111a-1]EJT74096.1 hypothetical protein GGTG_07944 [Gaeumannomyces tritici R3-111a-1]
MHTAAMEPAQSRLGTLSVELIIHIINYLDGPDLLALLQTDRRLSAASLPAVGDFYFKRLDTNLTRESISRVLGAARFERFRHRVRALHISPWSPVVEGTYDCTVERPRPVREHDWQRDAAGRLDLTTPYAVALLECIRDGFPNCRTFVVDDSLSAVPDSRLSVVPTWLYPTDGVAIVLALAADPANPSPVQSLTLYFSRKKDALQEHLLQPGAVRGGNWNALHTLRFIVSDVVTGPSPDPAVDEQPFIHALLSSSPNLNTFVFGGSPEVEKSCIDGVCQQAPSPCSIRHLSMKDYSLHTSGPIPPVWLDQLFSGLDGDKLQSLNFKGIHLQTEPGCDPWVPILFSIKSEFPYLRSFTTMGKCGKYTGGCGDDSPNFFCPLLRHLTDRLGAASFDYPCSNACSEGNFCPSVPDEHGGSFQFHSTISGGRMFPEERKLGMAYRVPRYARLRSLHERGVRRLLGEEGLVRLQGQMLGWAPVSPKQIYR